MTVVDGKQWFVRPSANTAELELSAEYYDVLSVKNWLVSQWQHSNEPIRLHLEGAALDIVDAGFEFQNWHDVAGWEKCVLLELA